MWHKRYGTIVKFSLQTFVIVFKNNFIYLNIIIFRTALYTDFCSYSCLFIFPFYSFLIHHNYILPLIVFEFV